MPQALFLQGAVPAAQAAEAKPSAKVVAPPTKASSVGGKKQGKKALDKANGSKPAPLWYVQARQKEANRLAQTRKGMKMLLAQNTATQQRDFTPPTVTTKTQVQGRAESVSGPPLLRAEFPGDVRASAPLAPSPKISSLRLDLSDGRVPGQEEIVSQGGLAGPLSPAAPADPEKIVDGIDQTLRREGFAQGLKTPFPTEAQVQGVPSLVAKARHFDDAKKKAKVARDQNREFALAMEKWNASRFAESTADLNSYLEKYPDSPWAPEALIHIGNYAKYTGRGNEAEDAYRQVLAVTSDDPSEMSYNAHRKAFGRLTDLYLIQGRYKEARPMLEDFFYNDTNWRRRTWGLYWLNQITASGANTKALLAERDCGTQALAALLVTLHKPQQARQVREMKPTNTQGFSLAELRTIASRQGVTLTGFAGTPSQLTHLPLPALLHYSGKALSAKSKFQTLHSGSSTYGHYVLLRSYDARRSLWHIDNAQSGISSTLSASQLAREWSGRGLMLERPAAAQLVVDSQSKPIKSAVVRLSLAQMRTTFGAGYDVMGAGDISCTPANAPVRGNCGGPGGCGCQGEPGVSVNRINQNVFITDTPLWYTPAKGPRVDITVSYNSLNASNYNTMVGNKWDFNYGTYLAETANKVTLFRPNGGQDFFTSPATSGTTTTYAAPRGVFSTFTKNTTNNTFTLQDQQGNKSVYGSPANVSTTALVLLQQTDRWNQSLTFQYGVVAGKVVPFTITDADGKLTRLQYDAQGYLIFAQTPDERQANFSYDVNGNLIQCVDAAGQAFQYAYDGMVNVVQLNTAQGPWTFAYEKTPQGSSYREFKTTIYDPTQNKPQIFGFTTQDPYHNPGRYYSVDHRGNTTVYGIAALYDSYSGITTNQIGSITPPTGASISYSYDSTGASHLKSPIAISDNAVSVTMGYNGQGLPTSITQRVGSAGWPMRTTTLTYDSNNNLDVTGAVISGQLTSSGPVLTQTILQSAIYNGQHQPTQTVDSAGHVTDYTYTAWGAPLTTTRYEGGVSRVTTGVYGTNINAANEFNRLIGMQYNGATLRTFTHDNSGRVKTDTDARNLTTEFHYNNLDKLTGTYYPDGTSELIDYTCCSLPGMITDRSGRRAYYDYDSLKRVLRAQDADGQTLQFDYDTDGNRTGMMDAKGVWTRWSYDALNRIVARKYADGRTENTHYNIQGHVDFSSNARGGVTNYSYNWSGALTGIDYPNATSSSGDVSLSYDALGRPASMTDAVGNTSWSYDASGRKQGEDGPWANDTLTYSYDSLSRLSGLSIGRDAGSIDTLTYGYDALSRLSSLSATIGSWGSLGSTTYNYVGNSATMSDVTLPNNTRRVYGYEASGLKRFNSVSNSLNNTTNDNISSFSYNYDSSGAPAGHRDDRTSQTRQYGTETAQTASYSYNQTSMLTSESGAAGGVSTPSFARSYSFDAMGNRTQWSDAVAHTRSDATYNRLNQLTGLSNYDTTSTPTLTGTVGYDYDGDGNMVGKTDYNTAGTATGSTVYTYDDASRLTSIVTPNSSKWVFVYDGLSRLRKSLEYSWIGGAWVLQEEKWRLYRGMDVVQERDGTNSVKASVIRDGNIGGILARVTGSGNTNRAIYGYDGSGNVATLTDGNAAVIASYTYDAFGNILKSSGTTAAAANPYRFSTKEQIGGLYYYGFRFYSTSIGRWINRDPIREDGGVNIYGFVGNNPVNRVDGDGRFWWTLAGIAAGGAWGWLTGGWQGAIAGAAGSGITSLLVPAFGPIIAGLVGGAVQSAILSYLTQDACHPFWSWPTLIKVAIAAAIGAFLGALAGAAGLGESGRPFGEGEDAFFGIDIAAFSDEIQAYFTDQTPCPGSMPPAITPTPTSRM